MIKSTNPKVRQLYDYVQERCLWQFYSRSWDRRDNIENITRMTGAFLTGKTPEVKTVHDHQYFADAKMMAADLNRRYAWLADEKPESIGDLMGQLRDELLDLAVDNCGNTEINWSFY
jgi:vanadium nitrogenase delta subunit